MSEKNPVEFIEWMIARGLADKTIEQYVAHYKLLARELEEANKNKLTQKFVNEFLIRHPSTTSRYFMKNVFEFFNVSDLEIPKIKGRSGQKKRRSIRPEERKQLRSWLYHRSQRFGLMFDLSYYCALRRSEVLAIKFDDFYLEDFAEDTSKPCRLQVHGKGKKERPVMIPPKIANKLFCWLPKDIGKNDRIFKVGKSKWHEVFKEAVKKTGCHNYSLHDLRRTRATYWLDNGVDIVRVSIRLGHSSVSTTQRYINVDEERELKRWEQEF